VSGKLKFSAVYFKITEITRRRHIKHKKCSKLNRVMLPQVQLKDKVKFSELYTMKMYGEWMYVFLTSARVGGEWSASHGKVPPISIG
jgi:hypothetical protein